MVTLLVVVLVICLLLLAAVLAALVVLRRRIVTSSGVFRCKVRVTRGAVPHLSRRWPRRVSRAEWQHDVLVLHTGPGLTWALPLAVRFAEDVIEPVAPTPRVRMGKDAVMLRLRLDDDTVVAVAAPAWAQEKLAGPFLAIAVRQSPPGISERRH